MVGMTWTSIFRDNLMDGKVGIVTGGGSGIGKAIANEISNLGGIVIIASRDLEKLNQVAKSMNILSRKGNVVPFKCNIRVEEDIDALFAFVMEKFGKIDFLVNNGGGQFPTAAENLNKKGWNAVIETNLTGTFQCCQKAFHSYMEKHGGTIVNIIANYFNGFPGMIHTAAARAGVDTLTKTLASEWAEFGVRVNCVAPGIIYSATAEANYSSGSRSGDMSIFEDHLSGACPRIPFRRLGTVEEVSSMVVFLLSDGGAYVSGATFKVDGALSVVTPYWDIRPTVDNPETTFPVYGMPLPPFAIAKREIVGKFDAAPVPERDQLKLLMLRGKL